METVRDLAQILYYVAMSIAGPLAVITYLKAKKAERKKKLRLDILEKRLGLSRKIIDEELREVRTRDSSLDGLFGLEQSNAEKRKRNEREIDLSRLRGRRIEVPRVLELINHKDTKDTKIQQESPS